MKTASSEGEDDNAVVAFRSALLPAAADAVDADHLFVLPRLSVVQFAGRARIMPHSDRAHCKNGGDDEDNCRWLVAYPFAKLFFFNGVLLGDFYKMCIRIPELYHMA